MRSKQCFTASFTLNSIDDDDDDDDDDNDQYKEEKMNYHIS